MKKIHKLCWPVLAGLLLVVAVLAIMGHPDVVYGEWLGNWYWKDGGWTDYAPSGVPDIDQKQAPWWKASGPWSHSGPVAAANSLWWFDSKFEPAPQSPTTRSDNYFLLTSYNPLVWDDHHSSNVVPFVDQLACYFETNVATITGTEVHTMAYGLQHYLYNDLAHSCFVPTRGGSYYDDYHVQLVRQPAWDWVVAEVTRSEDVILLLGFWQEQGGDWKRLGGHYVTVAGVNDTDSLVALSDPYTDSAEFGGAGRVLDGSLWTHSHGPHASDIHNDAGSLSHDIYTVTVGSLTPAGLGGMWGLFNYAYQPNFATQNVPNEFVAYQDTDNGADPIYVEVEYALAMSPFDWKQGGEWVYSYYGGEWIWEWWWYEDDGHSCLPDFAHGGGQPYYDGPVAVANSLWWFDSKAETLLTGGFPTPPPTISDHYNLVTAYGPWDDHHPDNTPPFMDELANNHLNTDPQGTSTDQMAAGIDTYLAAQNVDQDFYTTTQQAPSWQWIADEVDTSEDGILLLGFYEQVGTSWERKGGHWVNAAGVSRANNLIGLSDPYTDVAQVESFFDVVHMGRVFPPERQGTPFNPIEKQDPQAISHDIYTVTPSPVSERLRLDEYPVTATVASFVGVNGEGAAIQDLTANQFAAEVEWAIGVSPHSDLVLTKTIVITEVVPGDPVTYTLEYANRGLAAVDSVTITDYLPTDDLNNIVTVANPPISQVATNPPTWSIPRLAYGQQGVITLTAVSRVTKTLTNTAYITGLNAIGHSTPDRNLANNSSGYAGTPGLAVSKRANPSIVEGGSRLTYTLYVTNTGDIPLQATITDTLPVQVSPGGQLSWYTTIPASGGVWTEQVVVTATMGYSGTLTNVIYVTTAEGPTGIYTATSGAKPPPIYLPFILKP